MSSVNRQSEEIAAAAKAEIADADRKARNAVYSAQVSQAFLTFWKKYFNRGLTACQANRQLLEQWLDDRCIDCSDIANIEIAYSAIGDTLAHESWVEERRYPVAPAPAVTPVEPVSESDQIRLILQQHQGDPKAVAAAMRARLRGNDPARNRPNVLPADITPSVIRGMSASSLRSLQTKWFGTSAINDRLQGKS